MKLLITWGDTYSEEEKMKLLTIGYEIFYLKGDSEAIDENNICFKLSDIDAVVCTSIFKNNDISKFTKLKYIKTYSAGTDSLPHEYIKEHDIILENAKSVYSIPIAEYIVMKILEIYKSAKAFYRYQMEHKWKKNEKILELTDKKALIIGYGSIGIETAKRLKVFGVKINGIVGKNIDESSRKYVDNIYTSDKIKSLIPESDIIILSLPYSAANHHLIDEDLLTLMNNDAILINIARGKIIDEESLIKKLRNGKFLGVALDVFYNEPLDTNSPLWQFGNVSITPHVSNLSEKIDDRQFESVYNGLNDFYQKIVK